MARGCPDPAGPDPAGPDGSEAADGTPAVIAAPLGAVSSDVVKPGVQGDIRLRPSKQVCAGLGGTGKRSKLQNARNSADTDE